MPPVPDDLLGAAPLTAAVAALADRNRHHLSQMTDAERADGEVVVTPAQAAALELLEAMTSDDGPELE